MVKYVKREKHYVNVEMSQAIMNGNISQCCLQLQENTQNFLLTM